MKTVYLGILAVALSSCAPPRDAEVETAAEPPRGIHEEEVTYQSGGASFKGFLAYDARVEGPRPGVLVVHEWWGHNDYARSRARMLAEMGYTALAVDMYGDGKTADHPDDAAKFSSEVMGNRADGEARFRAALELLKANSTTDPERIAAIGYCFGGAVVLHAARIGEDLDGVVSFHGNLSSMYTPEPGSVKAKILVCHGAADSFIPQAQIDAFKTEMETAGADYRFVAYEGAKHSFTNKDADSYNERFGLDVAYDEKADRESWAAMKAFFEEIFATN